MMADLLRGRVIVGRQDFDSATWDKMKRISIFIFIEFVLSFIKTIELYLSHAVWFWGWVWFRYFWLFLIWFYFLTFINKFAWLLCWQLLQSLLSWKNITEVVLLIISLFYLLSVRFTLRLYLRLKESKEIERLARWNISYNVGFLLWVLFTSLLGELP